MTDIFLAQSCHMTIWNITGHGAFWSFLETDRCENYGIAFISRLSVYENFQRLQASMRAREKERERCVFKISAVIEYLNLGYFPFKDLIENTS